MRISDWSSDVCSSDLQIAVLALPAQPRSLGQWFLHDRSCIHKDLERPACFVNQPAGKRLEAFLYHVVIVLPLCIHGNPTNICGAFQRQGIAGRGIAHAQHDDGPDLRPKTLGRSTLRSAFFHRSEEHTSELQSLMRISYAVFCLKNK